MEEGEEDVVRGMGKSVVEMQVGESLGGEKTGVRGLWWKRERIEKAT